jgi:hypothetical protein
MMTTVERHRHELDGRLNHAITSASRKRSTIARLEDHVRRLGSTGAVDTALRRLRDEVQEIEDEITALKAEQAQ